MAKINACGGLLWVCIAALGAAGLARADVVKIPPVTVTSVETNRAFDPNVNRTSEGTGVNRDDALGTYTGGGPFVATIGTGDTVVLRVQAPSGHQFRIRHRSPHLIQFLQISLEHVSPGGGGNLVHDAQVVFENGAGSTPVANYVDTIFWHDAARVGVDAEYAIVGDFTFTAYEVRMSTAAPISAQARNYGEVNTNSYYLFGVFFEGPGDVMLPAALSIEPQVGACCIGGACTIVASTLCTGEFLGANSTCFPAAKGGRIFNACCPADVDGTLGLSVSDIFAFLSTWFSGCP
ncbi:MAG: hypothetical protein KF699_07285 [Phycisphaeraceae bacterium]|nr:hypothetical protein [Phycisphaeraceae bacterium]MBX3405158.1 hypothetical protein [Phycisphaeraceae bacterium]